MAEIIKFPADGFVAIDKIAHRVVDDTVAHLRMESGRTYVAVWKEVGRCTAWWPMFGPRKRPIGLFEPVSIRIVKNTAP